ncbi:MAG: right-handed parallel beta-helix repeat-containing protein, partial [Bacteroidota bacterium]
MLRYFFFLFLLLLFLVVKAETLTVCASGCDYVTIEGAVNLAVSGDTIDIQAGTFTESDIFIAENLTIRGQGPTLTIVQAADRPSAANGRVFFVEGEFTVSIENLTVRHGVAVGSDNNGGRIQIDCGPLTDVQLVNLIVSDNYAGDEGGGIHSFGSGGSISLTNCIISDNEANGNAPNSLGGGIYHSGAKTFILNRCSIVNNRAGDDGGGIYSRENSSVLLLTSCTLANNTIGSNNGVNNYGAGIFQRGTAAALRMINCTVVENSIIGTGEGLGAGVSVRAVGEVTLTNT